MSDNRTDITTSSRDHILQRIATHHLNVETLVARGQDELDFHSVAVWSIKAALNAAFAAGYHQGIVKHVGELVSPADGCPECGERDSDRLIWSEEEDRITCSRCNTTYTIEENG